MKASATRDLAIGGPTLAAHAFNAGLIDVCHLFIAPIIVGDGSSAFPSGIRLELALQDERRFRNGMVYLHYRSTTSEAA
jgi:dihydrofolate reductase